MVVLTNTCWNSREWLGGVRWWGGWLGGADLALARKLRLSRVKVGRNLFTFETEDFIHSGWKLMTKFYGRVRISVSNFISQSSHHCIDVSWSRISINSLRVYRPHAFDIPEIIPFVSKTSSYVPWYRQRVGMCFGKWFLMNSRLLNYIGCFWRRCDL